jgi:hypothetical protein
MEFYKDKYILALNSIDSLVRLQGYNKIILRIIKRKN